MKVRDVDEFSGEELQVLSSFERELLQEYKGLAVEEREKIENQYHTLAYLKERVKIRLEEARKLFDRIKWEIENDKIDQISFTRREFIRESALTALKPYMESLEELLTKNGFIKIHKKAWRKLNFTTEESKQVEKAINRVSEADKEKAHIMAVAWEMWKRTKFDVVDWLGYNRFDAIGAYNRFVVIIHERPSEETRDKIFVWFAKKLTRYEMQVKELGLDFDRLKNFVANRGKASNF